MIVDTGDENGQNHYHHLLFVTNIFRHQHLCSPQENIKLFCFILCRYSLHLSRFDLVFKDGFDYFSFKIYISHIIWTILYGHRRFIIRTIPIRCVNKGISIKKLQSNQPIPKKLWACTNGEQYPGQR